MWVFIVVLLEDSAAVHTSSSMQMLLAAENNCILSPWRLRAEQTVCGPGQWHRNQNLSLAADQWLDKHADYITETCDATSCPKWK